ncbi:Uncharacterized protein Fot_52643 [Forsythia ovata]|uniref:Uncharacterized protein n=1 Tax=Forsythia ovata TaxID=205694 RepID=A0ABD1PLA3_9LAMI
MVIIRSVDRSKKVNNKVSNCKSKKRKRSGDEESLKSIKMKNVRSLSGHKMEVNDIEPSKIEIDEVYMDGLIHTSPRQPTVVDDDDPQHHQLNFLIPSIGVDKFQTRDIRNNDDDFEITPLCHLKTFDVPTPSKQPRRKCSKSPKSPTCTGKMNQELSLELLKMKSQMSAMQ